VLAELASIVAPIYLVVALGFGWARGGRRFDTELVTELIMKIGAPCLVFASLAELEADATGELLAMAGATVAAIASFAAVGSTLLRAAGLPIHTFLSPITFVNSGNIGLPVCLFAFGEEGLALAVVFFAVTSLAHFTVGQWLWVGRASGTALAREPLSWACGAAVAVLAAGVPVPDWLERTTSLLGGMTIPLMQFSLGVSLARLEVAGLGRSAALALLRVVLGVSVGVGLAAAFGFQGVARGVLVLDCAMPAAVINYMMAERHRRSPEEVASLVVLSTLLAFVTLPLLLAWLLRGA